MPRLIVPVTGTLGTAATPKTPTRTPMTSAEDAASKPAVTGSFSIQGFGRTTEDTVAAVGTLTLSFTDPTSGAARTIITQAPMRVAKASDTATTGENGDRPAATPPAPRPAAAQACETLSLVLMPLDLDLPDLKVQLDEVNVDLTVAQGVAGPLGNQLCAVAELIGGTAPAAELVKALNAVLGTIG